VGCPYRLYAQSSISSLLCFLALECRTSYYLACRHTRDQRKADAVRQQRVCLVPKLKEYVDDYFLNASLGHEDLLLHAAHLPCFDFFT